MIESKLPEITLAIEAKPWPKGHIARIASMRGGQSHSIRHQKIQSAIVAK